MYVWLCVCVCVCVFKIGVDWEHTPEFLCNLGNTSYQGFSQYLITDKILIVQYIFYDGVK